jgi:hypothetical protein
MSTAVIDNEQIASLIKSANRLQDPVNTVRRRKLQAEYEAAETAFVETQAGLKALVRAWRTRVAALEDRGDADSLLEARMRRADAENSLSGAEDFHRREQGRRRAEIASLAPSVITEALATLEKKQDEGGAWPAMGRVGSTKTRSIVGTKATDLIETARCQLRAAINDEDPEATVAAIVGQLDTDLATCEREWRGPESVPKQEEQPKKSWWQRVSEMV